MHKPKITLSFLGNLNYDSRCNNLLISLNESGFDTQFIGFDWQSQNFQPIKKEKITIYKLSKGSSLFFYLKFTFLLSVTLFRTKSKIYFAEDIYTLPLTTIVAFFKRAKVVYDSREIYGSLAGLVHKKFLQFALQKIETFFIRRVDCVLVTGEMDRDYLINEYQISCVVVLRNLPRRLLNIQKVDLHKLIGIEKRCKILVYQGVILHGRGLGILIETIKKLDDFILVIIGEGEKLSFFKALVNRENLNDKVFFLGKVNNNELLNFTKGADIGTALIENLSLSYYYALPNKLFEYIMCGVPVLVSNLPQMQKIIDEYSVGRSVDIANPDEIISAIKAITDKDTNEQLIKNCFRAAEELNWENEFTATNKILKTWL